MEGLRLRTQRPLIRRSRSLLALVSDLLRRSDVTVRPIPDGITVSKSMPQYVSSNSLTTASRICPAGSAPFRGLAYN